MENKPPIEDDIIDNKIMHSSVNFFRKKNTISLEKDKKGFKKRSSSMLLKNNFVPKLKPIKANICPSPINLNQKSPPQVPNEVQNLTISTASFDSQNDLNSKPIKILYSKRKKPKKKSFKIINIEEEALAISDYEDNSKKESKNQYESESSSEDEIENDKDKDKDNNIKTKFTKIKNKIQNINTMRKRMIEQKRHFLFNSSLLDDSDINKRNKEKVLNHYKNIGEKNFLDKERKSRNLIPNHLGMIKYRTKSFHVNANFVTSILGFLEKNNSANSLKSHGK